MRPFWHLLLLPILLGFVSCTTARLTPPPAGPKTPPVSEGGTEQAAPKDAIEDVALRLLTSDWRPYTGEQGGPRIALALVEIALGRAGYTPVFDVYDVFAHAEAKLRDPQYAGSPALWRNDERETYLAYSDPYLQNRLVLVARAGIDVSATDLSQLVGKRVGIVRRYAYGDEVDAAKGPTFVQEDTTAGNLRSLLDGKVDYVLVDELLIHHLVKQQPEAAAKKIVVGKNALVRRTLHLAIQKDRPDAQAILDGFNEVLKSMVADGTYHAILGVQWIHADVDGDGVEELTLGGTAAGEEPPNWAYPIVQKEAVPKWRDHVKFFVDGTLYQNWNEIPERYRVPPKPELAGQYPGTDTVSIIEFRF